MAMVHRSVKLEDELWKKMKAKAHKAGFESVSAYLRHVIQEDVAGAASLESAEDRLVSTISKLSAKMQSLGTMHQTSFATLWALLELFMEASAANLSPEAREKRLQALRVKIAADVRLKYDELNQSVQ